MAFSANTVGDTTWRRKFFSNLIQETLKNALIAEKICQVDRTDNRYIYNPYGSAPTTTVSALDGTYSVSTYTTTNDTLEVLTEFKVAEQIYGYEEVLSNFNLFSSRMNEMAASVATAIDKYVLNRLCEDGTGTYTTPTGGFTTAANFNTICANLLSKVAGYAVQFSGLFLVVENTDLTGIIQAQGTNGFSMADAALRNGFLNSWMGIDIYVARTGTFSNSDGTNEGGGGAYTNSGHRVFGVKGITTYAAPRGLKWEELVVTGATGKEVRCWGLIGFKAWYAKNALIVDITLA